MTCQAKRPARALARRDLIGLKSVVPAALAALGLSAGTAHAVPAFAVQTGQPCQTCHVGGFGPQLTAFGRDFKLKGYTARMAFNLPISAMAEAGYVHTETPQAPPRGFNPNNNIAVDQVSLFIAGGLGAHLGGFVQTTYDGIGRSFHWDNMDLRATTTATLGGQDVVLGTSINNSPTAQDAWNTLPAWGYPYATSSLVPGPSYGPLFNGGFAQTTLGMTAYAWINSEYFIEAGAYGTPGATSLYRLGVDPTSPGSFKGLAPYGRVAFQKTDGPQNFEIGVFGMRSEIYPGLDHSTGFTDGYTDLGVDGSFQKRFDNSDMLTLNARYLHEQMNLKATCALVMGAPGCASNTMQDLRADVSYYWRQKIGATLAAFNTTGTTNLDIFSTLNGSPNATGFMLQLDGTPFGAGNSPLGPRFNLRAGVQYTLYTRFDGGESGYAGPGTKASDNNSLRVFTWIAY